MMIVSNVDQILLILVVHRQNHIEIIQVIGIKQACPGEQFNSFALSDLAALAIGFLADVPGGGSGRVDIKIGLKVLFIYEMLKDPFGSWAPADIAEADKAYFIWVFSCDALVCSDVRLHT